MAKINMDEIAKSLGVSKGLVSKAMRGKYGVSEETRAKIFMQATNLGYDFSKLRNKKTSSLVIIYISDKSFKNEVFWQPIIAGIESKLAQYKIKTSFFNFSKDGLTEEEIRDIKAQSCAGRIIIHHNYDFLFKAFNGSKIPTVVIDPKFASKEHCLEIKYSNELSSFDLTEYLIGKGHKKIIYYGSPNFSDSFYERFEGFKSCVSKHKNEGVTYFDACFDNSDYSFANVELLKKVIIKSNATAIQCSNDLIAYSAYTAVKELGLAVGKDISVVGFDNSQEATWIFPSLTTVSMRRTEIGAIAAKFIIDSMETKKLVFSEVSINCELIERNSVRDLNNIK